MQNYGIPSGICILINMLIWSIMLVSVNSMIALELVVAKFTRLLAMWIRLVAVNCR